MKRVIVFCVIFAGLAAAGWLLLQPPKPPEPQKPAWVLEQSSPTPTAQATVAPTEPSVDSEVSALSLDLIECTDDTSAPECIAAITPLIAAMPVIGDLSYVDLIERLDANMRVIQESLADESCAPPDTGWSTRGEQYDRCGAEAFAEIGRLLQGCFAYKWGTDGAWSLEYYGVTDLQMLADADLKEGIERVEYEWLKANCLSVSETVSGLPELFVVEGLSRSFKWRQRKLAAEYIQRAVLMGDYRVADRLAESAAAVNKYLDMERGEAGVWRTVVGSLIREDQKPRVAEVRKRDELTEQLIRKIIVHDPGTGYQQLANHEYYRFPDFNGRRPDWFEDEFEKVIAFKNSLDDVKSGKSSPYYYPPTNWEQRTFDIVKRQLVANRLAGRSEELHFIVNGAGHLEELSGMIDMYLDANEVEYASQQAWEIVEKIRANSEPDDE
ncbi:MAG TPA: hypothetical protein DER02_07270 [Gammaproteobacteria bacterium]|nr:hypothetical protein [Gammaproteobacteria bacterium]|tara:strand:- start:5978 stop:7297 length:1320 start_codon:yes stop_codon:yes gene_type:complete